MILTRILIILNTLRGLLKRYNKTGELKTHLIINHFIVLYNIFGDAATPMLFFKIDEDMWVYHEEFLVFLNRLPDYPKCYIHDIPIDKKCLQILEMSYNERS